MFWKNLIKKKNKVYSNKIKGDVVEIYTLPIKEKKDGIYTTGEDYVEMYVICVDKNNNITLHKYINTKSGVEEWIKAYDEKISIKKGHKK